jgi:hypothetical protein
MESSVAHLKTKMLVSSSAEALGREEEGSGSRIRSATKSRGGLRKGKPDNENNNNTNTSNVYGAPAHRPDTAAAKKMGPNNHMLAKMERYGLISKKKNPRRSMGPADTEVVGPTETTINGLKAKYRSEADREQRYLEWKEIQSGKSSYVTLDAEEVRVDPHPLLVNTMTIIHRENAISKGRSRQRLLNRRFNLDVRDIWLSNLRHIADLRNVSNSYTKAAGFDDYDDDEDPEAVNKSNPNNWGSLEVHRQHEMHDRGLRNRRDVKSMHSLDTQVQSVSNARALHHAYHSTYMRDPKIVLDYKPPPTPILVPPPPEPPLLEHIVPGVLLHAVHGRVSAQRVGTTGYDSAHHIAAWSSRSAASTLSAKLKDPAPTDTDVILYIDRLVPSVHDGSNIFWRLLAMRRGDSKTAVVIGKEVEIAEYIGSLWLEDQEKALQQQDHDDSIVGDDYELMKSEASGQAPFTVSVYDHMVNVTYVDSLQEEELLSSLESEYIDNDSTTNINNNSSKSTTRKANKQIRCACLVNLVSRQGKVVPFCAGSAASDGKSIDEDHMYCRLNRSIDIEIHLSIPQQVANACLPKPKRLATSRQPEENEEAEADEDDEEYVELVLTTSPMELQQLLQIPISPVNNFSWWGSRDRVNDVWPALVAKLRLFPMKQADDSSYIDVLSVDFSRVNDTQSSSSRRRSKYDASALSLSQAFAIAQELMSRVVVQYEYNNGTIHNTNGADSGSGTGTDSMTAASNQFGGVSNTNLSIFVPGSPMNLFTSSARRPRSSKSNKSRLSEVLPAAGSPTKAAADTSTAASVNSKSVEGVRDTGMITTTSATATEASSPADPSSRQSSRPSTAAAHRPSSSSGRLKRSGTERGWEDLSESPHCLSLQLNGGVHRLAQVPGACEFGVRGIWQKPPAFHRRTRPTNNDEMTEYTRASALFFRNPLISTTNMVLVHMCLGIEVPIQVPCMKAWEDGSVCPLRCPPEPIYDVFAPTIIICTPFNYAGHIHEPLDSPIDRLSQSIMVYITACVEGYDRIPSSSPNYPESLYKHKYVMSSSVYGAGGFRNSTHYSILNTDPITPTYIFGLTQLGATLNEAGTNPRNVWRSTLVIREFVNRELLPKDFQYIANSKSTSGLNDPFIHTIHLLGEEFNHLQRIPLKKYDDFYREVQERRNIFNRQLALSNLIERSAVSMCAYVCALPFAHVATFVSR